MKDLRPFFDREIWRSRPRWMLVGLAIFLLLGLIPSVNAQAQRSIAIARELQLSGTVKSLSGDRLVIVDVDGKEQTMQIQRDDNHPIMLIQGKVPLENKAKVIVLGLVKPTVMQKDMIVSAECLLATSGSKGTIRSMVIKPLETILAAPEKIEETDAGVVAKVSGRIKSINNKQVILTVPQNELAPRGTITLPLTELESVAIETASLGMVRSGDVVTSLLLAELTTGDRVVRQLQVDLVDVRDDLKWNAHEQLELTHSLLSDQPMDKPREFETRNFLITTDISERQVHILSDKLESMYHLIAAYYGRRTKGPIECYVVHDIGVWDTRGWNPIVITKIENNEGVTIWAREGGIEKTAVFASESHDIVQHEAVHGFCYLAFGGVGPLWYAEGMAEMGLYWKQGDQSVTAAPAVLTYLNSRMNNNEMEPLSNIVQATTIEGDYWKAYAWRWSLCHFLANNPNYSKKFNRLGPAMMTKKRNASFDQAFGNEVKELSFEYLLFMNNLQAGLRVDLCAWQWDVKAKEPDRKRKAKRNIVANRGWQATGALLKSGESYQITTTGTWKDSAESEMTNADGNAVGKGKLIGVIFSDYQLSDEFEIGSDRELTVETDGHLYVRFQESLAEIADNEGEVAIEILKK